MFNTLRAHAQKPELYASSTAKFWDDAHISKGMLAAHLEPAVNAATRNHAFVEKSVAWMTYVAPPCTHPLLLDLGCGPGIYAVKLHEQFYQVTGIDFSERAIAYAKDSAATKAYDIRYLYQDYLQLHYTAAFDVVTLIYCDFGVLSDENRKILLKNIYTALKPGGKCILDVFTPTYHAYEPETTSWSFEEAGFWSAEPSMRCHAFYRYDAHTTVLNQNIIITENRIDCYNIWEHMFTEAELQNDFISAGFATVALYGDVAGAKHCTSGGTLCAVAVKH